MLFINQNGQSIAKSMDLQDLRSGTLKIDQLTISDRQIRLLDEVAVVSVLQHLQGCYQHQSFEGTFRYSRV